MNKEINTQVFDKFPEIESERLIFQELKMTCAPDLFFIRSNDEVMNYMDSHKHQTIQDTEKFINNILASFNDQTGINWAIFEKSTNTLYRILWFLEN